jgi:hypothetical protein
VFNNFAQARAILSLFLISTLCLLFSSCASVESRIPVYDQSLTATPLRDGSARIAIARRPNMLGAIVTHYILDCGSSISYNSKLIRANDIHIIPLSGTPNSVDVRIEVKDPMLSNKGVMGRVELLILPKSTSDSKYGVIHGQDDVFIKKYGISSIPVDMTSSVREFPDNCYYVGSVGNGDYVIFDRLPDNMRLRVVTPGGDESFAPDFKIEAGKRYFVDYQYGISGSVFTIQERP